MCIIDIGYLNSLLLILRVKTNIDRKLDSGLNMLAVGMFWKGKYRIIQYYFLDFFFLIIIYY